MKKKTITLMAVVLMGTLIAVSCKKKEETPAPTPMPAKTLYERLGGNASIKAVVDKFIEYVAMDTTINSFFSGTIANNRVDALKMNLVNQIGQASGGPEKYTGKDMVTAHTGMNIQDKHFDALVGDLVKSLDYYKVGETEKNELLSALAPMRKDIVGK